MRSLLAPAAFLAFSASLFGQAAPSIDPKAMLEGLQAIKDQQAKSSKHLLSQTIADFGQATADDGASLQFYAEAVHITRFVGRPDADTAFAQWSKTTLPRINPAAIHTTLRYTTITLQRAAGATDDQIFPVLLTYAEETQVALPSLLAPLPGAAGQPQQQRGEGRRGERGAGGGFGAGGEGENNLGAELMNQGVDNNIFAKWYDIGSQLGKLQNWEMVPANVDNMYTNFLLPYMRNHKDPRVLTYWDNRLAAGRDAASSATAEFSTDRYNTTIRPGLLWGRAEDEIAIGRREQGVNDMYNLVKSFPAHPEAAKWIKELEGILTAPAPASSPASTAQ